MPNRRWHGLINEDSGSPLCGSRSVYLFTIYLDEVECARCRKIMRGAIDCGIDVPLTSPN